MGAKHSKSKKSQSAKQQSEQENVVGKSFEEVNTPKIIQDDQLIDISGVGLSNSPYQNTAVKSDDPFDIFSPDSSTSTSSGPNLVVDKYDLNDLFTHPSAPIVKDPNDPFACILELDCNQNSASTFSFMAPKETKADYSRTNFDNVAKNTGIKKVSGNEFEDLLSGFQRSVPEVKRNKTMAELRNEFLLKSGADPIKIKISGWINGKENNIRALLSTLDTMVWEGCNWQKISMNQLVTFNDVKKVYRKACLAIHPDKLVGSENEDLAKYIFMELNDAWTKFEMESK